MQIREIDRDFEDLCMTSINILEERVRKYLLSEHQVVDPWFLDSKSSLKKSKWDYQTDVVLFGNFVYRFFESGSWPLANLRFWVLSSSVKKVMVEIFKLPEQCINIIPRYKIFKFESLDSNFSKNMTMICGTRISETKNIESFLYTVNKLQVDYHYDITPVLSGNYDNISNIYSIKDDSFSYQERIEEIIESLEWKTKPVIRHNLNSDDWLNREDENPVFVSFSTFFCEDFGVSLAQAQEKNWPCIVSDWGGHRDAIGKNLIKVPSNYLIEESGIMELLSVRANQIAEFLHQKMTNPASKEEVLPKEDIPLGFITLEELDRLRRDFVKDNTSASLWLARGEVSKYKAVSEGDRFFLKFQELFGGYRSIEPRVVIITNDLKSKIPGIQVFCQSIGNELVSKNIIYEFIPLNKVLRKNVLKKIKQADKLIIPFAVKSMDSFFYFIRSIIPEKNIEIFYGDEWDCNQEKKNIGKWSPRALYE